MEKWKQEWCMDTSNACEVLTAQNNHQIFLGRPSLSRLSLFLLLDCPPPTTRSRNHNDWSTVDKIPWPKTLPSASYRLKNTWKTAKPGSRQKLTFYSFPTVLELANIADAMLLFSILYNPKYVVHQLLHPLPPLSIRKLRPWAHNHRPYSPTQRQLSTNARY